MSWQELISIRAEAIEDLRLWQSQPPVACPNDGEPLRQGPNGVLFCISDGWQYPRDYQHC